MPPDLGHHSEGALVRVLPEKQKQEIQVKGLTLIKELARLSVGLAQQGCSCRAAWWAGKSQAGADAAVHRWNFFLGKTPALP